jgi:hypothetical protein
VHVRMGNAWERCQEVVGNARLILFTNLCNVHSSFTKLASCIHNEISNISIGLIALAIYFRVLEE